MRKTARPVVWESAGAQTSVPEAIVLTTKVKIVMAGRIRRLAPSAAPWMVLRMRRQYGGYAPPSRPNPDPSSPEGAESFQDQQCIVLVRMEQGCTLIKLNLNDYCC